MSQPTWRELAVRLVHVARIMYQRSSWRRWQRRRVSRLRYLERVDRDIWHLKVRYALDRYSSRSIQVLRDVPIALDPYLGFAPRQVDGVSQNQQIEENDDPVATITMHASRN